MSPAMLSSVVAGALRAAMKERLVVNARLELCAWCQRPFDVMGTRYVAPHDEWYCSAGCRDLDGEDA